MSFYSARNDFLLPEIKASGFFKVESDGSVWRCDTRNQYKKNTGFWRQADTAKIKGRRKVVQFRRKLVYAHRLVWFWFNGPIPEGYVVDHIDGDCTNNDPINLQVLTPKENFRKAVKNKEIKGGSSQKHREALKAAWQDPVKRAILIKNTEKATAASALARQHK